MAEEATAEEIKPGSPEYDKQMADRFNNPQMPEDQGEEAAPVPSMPDGGQESHARELQFNAAGRKKPEAEGEDQPELKQPQIEKPEDQEVTSIVNAAGLDETALQDKIRENGDLSAEDYAALAKVGVPEGLARTYVENLTFRMQDERASE